MKPGIKWNVHPIRRWRGLSRTRRAIAAAVLVPALAATLLTVSVAAPVAVQDKPGVETVTVDGKTYAKEAVGKATFSAEDLGLAHDAVTKHALGQAVLTPIVWQPGVPYYTPSPHNWWMEAEVYILHRQEFVGNPPLQLDYYRGGFEWASMRGNWDEEFGWFGPQQYLALNHPDIYLTLIEHPLGGTLTHNLAGPIIVDDQPIGQYTCDWLTQEVSFPYDPDTVIRTNLVVRPIWKYWSSPTGSFRTNPYGQIRRMTHSEGLIADGTDTTVQEAYTDTWSGFVSIPGNAGSGDCAPETINEPGM